jgi:carboxyl-terminal processing protease
MIRSLRIPLLLLFLMTGLYGTSPSADTSINLNGDDVLQITRTFLRNHYSRAEFDDEHSRLMFRAYLDQYDPGHYYFLQKDIDEFAVNQAKLDDLVEQRNLEFAFAVVNRFKQRLAERNEQIFTLLDETPNLDTEERLERNRKNAAYPKDAAEAEKLWRVRLKFDLLELMAGGSTADDAREQLRKRHRNFQIRLAQSNHNDIVSSWLNAFTGAYDPHSAYMSPDELENFNISLRLSLEGIGATLRSEDGYTIISSIIPGGAAEREGSLKPEDKIIGVGQGEAGEFEDVVNQRLADVVKLIRGPQGTKVRLSISRIEDRSVEMRKSVIIVRDKIVLKEGEASSRILQTPPDVQGRSMRVGLIVLPSFYVDFAERRRSPEDYKSSSQDVQRILEEFKAAKVDGVVLDLRNNGGGGLDEAVSLSGLFLERGPVVMVKDFRGRLSVLDNPHTQPVYRGPMVVITNRFSASASEILAGALKDYGRAVLVGDSSTFGKGTVQNVINLREGLGAIKATVAKFYRPGSASTQNRGVVPDVVLPSVNSHLDVGESSLDNALPWDAISKAQFTPWEDLSPYVPILGERSRQRQSVSTDFRKIAEDVRTFLENKKRRDLLTVREAYAEVRAGHGAAVKEPGGDEEAGAKGDKAGKDPVLDESAAILRDFVLFSRSGTPPDIASKQESM